MTHKEYVAANLITRIINKDLSSNVLNSITSICTDYAAKIVIFNLTYSLKCSYKTVINDDNNEIFLTSSNDTYVVKSLISCNCNDFLDSLLPCKHVFFSRNLLNVEVFSKELICNRWKKKILNTFVTNIIENPIETIELNDIRNINLMSTRPIIRETVIFL